MIHRIEYLALELKKLAGWGVQSSKLPFCPVLREMAGVSEDENPRVAAAVMQRYIREAISSYPGGYEFAGRLVPVETTKRVFRLLLKIEGTGQDAYNRRSRVLLLLGGGMSVGHWRNGGPEWECLLNLARHMSS